MHIWSTAGASTPSRRNVFPASCSVAPSFTVAVAARACDVGMAAMIRRAEDKRDVRNHMAHHLNYKKSSLLSMILPGSCCSTGRCLFLAEPAYQQEGDGRNGDAQRQQDQAKPERKRQIALAGFQRNRSRHGAGEAGNVAADDEDGADLGNCAA